MHCYKHPNDETSLSCGRCERPICILCTSNTEVGMRCRECVPKVKVASTRRRSGLVLGGLAVVGLIVLATTVAGSKNDESSGSDYLDEYADYEAQYAEAIDINEIVDPVSVESDSEPARGHRFVAINVTIENRTDDEYPFWVTVSAFKLTDSESYAHAATASQLDPQLSDELELVHGEKTRGWVTFEIPDDVEIGSVSYWTAELDLPESSAARAR